jgi:hypothetical protein
MWAENGDQMAKQYGGSGAMHKVDDVATDVDGERELVLTGGAKNALVRFARNDKDRHGADIWFCVGTVAGCGATVLFERND